MATAKHRSASSTYDGGRLILELEPRVLLSADQPGAGLDDALLNDPTRDAAHVAYWSAYAAAQETSVEDPAAQSITDTEQRRELVVIDAATPDIETLLADLLLQTHDGSVIEVAVLDSDRSGIDQIDELLDGRSDLTALHIISHGSDGAIRLGDDLMTEDTLVQRAQSVQAWGSALTDNADILIYGCNLAQSADGRSFVDAVARLTGADVAASDDRTGHASLGGDWDLEYSVGRIEADVAPSTEFRQQWLSTLPDLAQGVWISTAGNNSSSGAPGLSDWDDAEVLLVSDPNLAFGEGTTNGTFSSVFDASPFGVRDIDAIHFVSRDLSVGTNDFQLYQGDVLLSFDADEILTSTNSLSADKEDVVVFRPDTPGDYSSGTFLMFFDSSLAWNDDIKAFSLVEQDTTVGVGAGATVLTAGTLLFNDNDTAIYAVTPGDLGVATTAGSWITLISGAALGFGGRIDAVDLVEQDIMVGDTLLTAGQVLISLVSDDSSTGSNNAATNAVDVFILNVTTAGPSTVADVVQFLDGESVNLDSASEDIDAFSLYQLDTVAPVVTVDALNTHDATPQLTGTIDDPLATVSVTVNGNVYAASNNGDGTWTLADGSITPALADNVYDILVSATDTVGNVGTDVTADELLVDRIAPVVAVDLLTTNDTTPQLTGTVDDPLAAISVSVNGNSYSATNNGDGTWTLADNTIAPALAEGSYDVSVTATDAVGNSGSDGAEYGIVTTAIGSGDDLAEAATVQADGRILLAGYSHNGANNDFALVRYNADFTLDASFGVGGIVITAVGTGNDQAFGVTVQADGKILVVGSLHSGSSFDIAVVRYNADGSLDSGFGTNGVVTTPLSAALDRAMDVVVQPDGKIVVAAHVWTGSKSEFGVLRYNADGSLDTGFGTGGVVTTSVGTGDDFAQAVALQDDGKILITGHTSFGSGNDFAVVRYNADGSLDTGFDNDGMVTTNFGVGSEDLAKSVVVQSDGKILVAGEVGIGDPDFALARYNADGSLDTSFDGDGLVTTAIGTAADRAWSVALQADGKILVGGNSDNGSNLDVAAARYNSDGSLDTSFDTDGRVMTAIGPGNDLGRAVFAQADGTILLTGASSNGSNRDFAAVRYQADGSVTAESMDDSIKELTIDLTAPNVTVDALVTNDNRPELTGTVDDPTAAISVTVNGVAYVASNNGDGTWTLADDAIAPALADGIYEVAVTATDTYSNVGSDVSTNELDVDATAPVVTVDFLATNDNRPELTGTVDDPTAAISVTVNGVVYVASNNGDGTWTLADDAIAPALADGIYEVAVTATDTYSNVGSDASTNELDVDATAPVVTVDFLATNDNRPELTGTVDDPTAAISVTVNGVAYVASNNGDGTWTLADDAIAPALADGIYEVAVTATDTYSNVGSDGTSNELDVDATAPIVTVNALVTNDNRPELTGTVDDPTAAISVTVNGVVYVASNNGDGTWTLADDAIAPALADGIYEVAVTATDTYSNVGSDGTSNELDVDATAPVVTVNALVTNDNRPELTGTVDDPTAAISVTVNGIAYVASNNGDGTWTLADDAIAPALADGIYEVAVTATDTYSNVGSDGTSNELDVDATAPIVTVNALVTNDNRPELTGTVDDPTAAISVTVNGVVYVASNNGDGTWTLADDAIAPALADGIYEVAVTATDTYSNVGSDASTNELDVDATAPVVTVDFLATNDNRPELTGTVDDPTAAISVTVNGIAYVASNNGDGTWTLADDAIVPALADGIYEVAVTATDTYSNVGSDGTSNELDVDATAPVVTVDFLATNDNRPELTGTVDDPTAAISVTVNGIAYVASNNGDGTWTLADDAIAPALADGIYEVAVTATDTYSNVGSDVSTNELDVDATAPVVTVNALVTNDNRPELTGTVDDPAAAISVTVNGIVYVASNNGDGTWTLADDAIAPALADGIYEVAVTATDTYSNVGSDGTSNELDVDATAPVVTVDFLATNDNRPELTGTVDDPAAAISVTVNGVAYVASNNGDGTWTLADDAIAPALADGIYEVAVTATDTYSNVGSDASTNELDVDATAPVVTVNALVTNDNRPELTGTVDDPTAAISVTVNGVAYVASNNGDGTWTLADDAIAPALADGIYEVAVTATDTYSNVGSDVSTNELTVTPNADPIAIDDAYSIGQDTPLLTTSGVDDLLLNDSDPDGDALIVDAVPVSGPANGILILNSDGTFIYTPNAGFAGPDSFVYRVLDGKSGWAEATVTIDVVSTPVPPIAGADAYTMAEDGELVIGAPSGVLANDFDPNGGQIVVTGLPGSGPTHGTLVLAGDGSFTYTPDDNFNGSDSFIYELTDEDGETALGTVTIDVTPINDAPAVSNVQLTTINQDSLSVARDLLLENGTDIDGDELTVLVVYAPQFGTLIDDGIGNYIYTPEPGFEGIDRFSYTVQDANGALATAWVYVDVFGNTSGATAQTSAENLTAVPGQSSTIGPPPASSGESFGSETGSTATEAAVASPPRLAPVSDIGPALTSGVQAPAAADASSRQIRDTLLSDESDDGSPASKPQKFQYDGVLDGFEFRGFGLETASINEDMLWLALDDMSRQMAGLDESSNRSFVITSIVGGSGLLLTTGLISWVLRGGALASALLSTLPLWRGMDPLPLLAGRRKQRKKDRADAITDTQIIDGSQDDRHAQSGRQAERMFADAGRHTDHPRRAHPES